jgi:hypothetical protein
MMTASQLPKNTNQESTNDENRCHAVVADVIVADFREGATALLAHDG